jgi:hypothetical protein
MPPDSSRFLFKINPDIPAPEYSCREKAHGRNIEEQEYLGGAGISFDSWFFSAVSSKPLGLRA